MYSLLYPEADNANATHFHVTPLIALELKVTTFLTVALFYRERSTVTVTVSNTAAIITAKFGLLTAVLMKTYFVSLVTLRIGQCFSTHGPWHQLYWATRDSPGIDN